VRFRLFGFPVHIHFTFLLVLVILFDTGLSLVSAALWAVAILLSVVLHELGHASGHPDRLNRDTLQQGLNDGFASESYAREELRAEISAMMTGDRLGTGHDPSRGAAYVSGWVDVLDKNPQEIVNASAEAQRMSNYLISRTQERRQDQKQGGRPAEHHRRGTSVIVEKPSQRRPGGTQVRVTPLRDHGLVRGAGRPGVRQDQFPSRTSPER